MNKPNKIAVVSDAVYPFNKGGKEKRIYDITTRLAKEGYAVTIYCMQWWAGEKTIVRDGVTFSAISPYYPLYAGKRRSIKEAIFFALHCFKLLGKDFDVVEIDHMPHLVLFTTKIVCLLKRKRMIVVWHEVWGGDYWEKYLGFAGLFAYWIEGMSAQLPDTIIAVSDTTAKALRDVLKVQKPIVTVPNGLDLGGIIKNKPADFGADIIFAGRLLAHKNIDVLLHAVSILANKNPKISALIIGNGPEKENLEKLSGELGVSGNISFRDFFENHNDLYRTMKAAKVFVLPSTREGFGIVVPEANACGLPVVTVDNEQNAARELVVHGENGMITALDASQIADAIETLLVERKGAEIYQKHAEKYDWKNIVARVGNVYSS